MPPTMCVRLRTRRGSIHRQHDLLLRDVRGGGVVGMMFFIFVVVGMMIFEALSVMYVVVRCLMYVVVLMICTFICGMQISDPSQQPD